MSDPYLTSRMEKIERELGYLRLKVMELERFQKDVEIRLNEIEIDSRK